MKQLTIEVKNCRNCCFSEFIPAGNFDNFTTAKSYAHCMAPIQIHVKYEISSYYKAYKSPNWCPLKKQSLKIEFKK